MKAIHTLIAAAALFGAAGAHAQQADHGAHHPTEAVATRVPQSEGEVRKVDPAQGKVTLRHGPLVNLDMPAMTMVFTVPDKKLLDGLKEGDKVKFTADKKDGAFIVTAIEAAK
jgi:Cu/Ag efflux protein CusF